MRLLHSVVAAAIAGVAIEASADVSVSTVGPSTTYTENFNGGTSFDSAWFNAPLSSDDFLLISALAPSSSYTFASAVALATLELSFWYSVPGSGNGIVSIAGSGPTLLADSPGNVAQYLLNNPGPASSGFNAYDAFFTTTLYDVLPGSYTVTFATAGGLLNSLKIDDVTIAAIAAPVPEPETYALMLAGLGMIGVLGRRRQRRHAPAE
jgi:hypothetical protein